MAQINPKITIRPVYFGMLLLSAAVMISAVRLTIASDLDSLKVAAEQGDATAQVDLGLMYNTGKGVPKDVVEAVRWLRMAAEQGHAKAQFYLGLMYAQGKGVPKDDVQAYAWMNIGIAQTGNEAYGTLFKILTEDMTASAITQAQSLSREYWEKYGPNSNSSE